MLYYFLFLIGFGLSIIGFMYIILYLNYLSIGLSIKEYLNFISNRGECYLAIIGLFIISIVILKKEKK
ncbi:MAG: hypothetical protein MR266_03080 [Erysipelotrichaceae bacterium]|nr:hypothetical protein [Erysipelotrichaceae bacterium]